MARVFISHASADVESVDQIHSWLRADKHTVFLDRDLRAGIRIGQDWKQRLYYELRHADAVVCVVTKAFTESSWCAAEVGIADALGCQLLPVRAEDEATHPLLEHLQYVDYQADPSAALTWLGETLRRLDARGRRQWRQGDNPFPGLLPFDDRLASMFFGRSKETRELSDQLRASSVAGTGLLAVTGPSGCGKSSLVRAGLLPRLADDPSWLVIDPFTPGDDPVVALALKVVTVARHIGLEGWLPATIRDRLASDDGLKELAEELLVPGGRLDERRVLLVIDQAEELFTHTDQEARDHFARLLRTAMDGPVRVVVTLRSEFLDDLRALPDLAEIDIDSYLVRPLNSATLPLVIEEPASIAGLHIDAELVTRLVTDTGGGEALPLLAFTLQQLAHKRTRGETLAAEHYDQLGGVQGAVATQADAALAAAETDALSRQKIVTEMVRLITVDENGRYSRRRVQRSDFPEPVQEALGEFVNYRLLTSTSDEQGQWLEVAHEALLSAWPPLKGAISEQAAMLRTVHSVEQAAAEWRVNKEAESFLWEEDRLNAAQFALQSEGTDNGQQASPTDRLSQGAHDFLAATHRRVAARHARSRRNSRIFIGGLASALVIFAALAILAYSQYRIAEQGQRIAISRQLAGLASDFRDAKPRSSMLLSAAAWDIAKTSEARGTALSMQSQMYTAILEGHTEGVEEVAFSPDGALLATAGWDNTRLWNVNSRTQIGTLEQEESVYSTAFSPDGTILATSGQSSTVRFWDVENHTEIATFNAHTDLVWDVAFSPDGTMLATAGDDGTVRLWDAEDHTEIVTLEGHTDSVLDVAFNQDGTMLASGSADYTVRLWDAKNQTEIATFEDHDAPVPEVTFDHSGTTLATASRDGTVGLWDVEERESTATIEANAPEAWGVAFSPNDALLAIAGDSGESSLWSVKDQTEIGTLDGHTHDVADVTFSPNGKIIATGSTDHSIRLWDARVAPPTSHDNTIWGGASNRNGTMFATGGNDDTVQIWDTKNRTEIATLQGHNDSVREVAFSNDGTMLATTGWDDTVRLWDTESHTEIATLKVEHENLNYGVGLTFSPDDTVLATSGWNMMRFWDVDSHEEIKTIEGTFYDLEFSPDGAMFATTGWDNSVLLWDAERYTEIAAFKGHEAYLTNVEFSPDGTVLASSSADRTVRLWDVENHTEIATLEGHTGLVHGLAFSPDGTMLATAGEDNTVRLWDVENHTEIATLEGHTHDIYDVAFGQDGTTVASVGADSTVRFWDLNPDRVLNQVCDRLRDDLTRDEWERFVPDLPYRRVCTG